MMLNLVRTHWPALVLAVLVGFLLVLPTLWAKVGFGLDFSHPVNIRIDDEFFYFARIKEVIDGHPTIGNAYLWEHKDSPPAPTFLGEYLLALSLAFFRADLVAGGVFYDFLLPLAAVLIAYTCLLVANNERWLSVFSAAFLFLGMFLTDFGRAISPQFNFLFWLSMFLLLWRLVHFADSPKQKLLLIVLSGLNFGLLAHIYSYYWTFYFVFFVVLAVMFRWSGFTDEAKRLGLALAAGLLVTLPYFWFMARAFALPEYAETLRRLGMIESRFPSGMVIVAAGFILLVIVGTLMKLKVLAWDRSTAFFAAGAIAAMASVNQHVITGKNLEFSSHYYMLSIFWFVIFVSFLIKKMAERYVAWSKTLIAGAFVISILMSGWGLAEVSSWFSGKLIGNAVAGRFTPVLGWISRNVKKDEVIYAPPALSELIPIYTEANVYFASEARLFFMPDAEVRDRFILNNYYRPLDRDFIRVNARAIWGVYYIDRAGHNTQANKVRSLLGLAPFPVDPIPEAAVEEVLKRSRELRRISFESELKKYRIDYVVWDREGEPNAEFDRLSFLESIADIDSFRIYGVF